MVSGLVVGRRVHYVPAEHEQASGRKSADGTNHRAADVVFVHSDEGTVDLLVLYDGTNDGQAESQCAVWKTSVMYDPSGKMPYSFHFMERAPGTIAP